MNLGTTKGYAQFMLLSFMAQKRKSQGKVLTVGEASHLIKKHEYRRGIMFGVTA